MVSETELAAIIQLGHDITSVKLYLAAVTALFLYDYFLTLKDEVRYAWKTESLLIFVLFLLTRYLPMVFQTWILIVFSDPRYTFEMCKRSAFVEIMYYTFIGLFAQIVLAQRTYAITGKNKWVAGILYTICAIQFSAGAFEFIWSGLSSKVNTSTIPLDSYRLCLPNIERSSSVVQMTLSVVFDITVFVVVLVQIQTIRSAHHGNGSRLLDTITRDAVIYFAVITTSHFLIVVMITKARPGLRAIPISGNAVFIPMMINRMIMSLKKAAASQSNRASAEIRTRLPMTTRDICSSPVDGIQLSALKQ